MSFFVAFDTEGVLGSRSVVPLSSPSSALQLEMEGHAVIVSGDGGGGGSVVAASEAVSGGRYAPEAAAAASIRSHR